MTFSIPLASMLALALTAQAPDLDSRRPPPSPRSSATRRSPPSTSTWRSGTSRRPSRARLLGKQADDADLARTIKVRRTAGSTLVEAARREADLYLLRRPVRHARLPGRRGAPRRARPTARPSPRCSRAGGPTAPIRWPARRDHPGGRRRRHARGPGPDQGRRADRLAPSSRPPCSNGVSTPRSASRSARAWLAAPGARGIDAGPARRAFGGGPITEPHPGDGLGLDHPGGRADRRSVRFVVRAKDADSARAIRKIAQDGLGHLADRRPLEPLGGRAGRRGRPR